MAKKLTIIIPHYKEPFETIKYLLDTIECQKGIDRNDFDVWIVNDGDENDAVILDKELFKQYHYEIQYMVKPHGGLSSTRNYGIEHGDSEYLMYCDSDDGFLNNYGLHLILGAIAQSQFDILYSSFIEEQPMGEGWKIYRRDKDMVFCHGKVYRRQFLIDKKLRFDTHLAFSEDSLFNKIASCEADEMKEITTPFYLWCWNEGSTVRTGRETIVLRRYTRSSIRCHAKPCNSSDKIQGFSCLTAAFLVKFGQRLRVLYEMRNEKRMFCAVFGCIRWLCHARGGLCKPGSGRGYPQKYSPRTKSHFSGCA